MSVHIIGITGPSCAGKTELARWLADALGAPVVPVDRYYRDLSHLPFAERARTNFDVPDAIEHDLLIRHIQELAYGRAAEIPYYDFSIHTRVTGTQYIEPGAFVVVEGLFTFSWQELRDLIVTKVYIGTESDTCLRRRVERDVAERGRTEESVVTQYRAHVSPMAQRYILPQRQYADVIVDGSDPISHSGESVLMAVRGRQVFLAQH